MRLLFRSDNGEYGLTKDLIGDDPTPPYAILSHTWNEGQEVTFEDLMDGIGKTKTGYHKIRFCGQQAELHGLQYFWVDTCCIDKSNKAEEQRAINSMFRFYRNATRCYVYLSDVSTTERETCNQFADCTWESAFRRSRWFTRGWTLQELLAPRLVEFFSKEGIRLGDNCSLKQQIHEVTGIPESALQGARLSQFSDKVRFSWIHYRQTKVEEDKAYSLLGIFDVEMPLRYGEGSVSAFKRLEEEIEKMNKCHRDLRSTDPTDDKKRIEETKGGLIKDSYRWIFDNADFQRWHNNRQSRLLWIKGDPGKGKTMLLCGIIDELEKSISKTALLSYFFCQATDSRINNATAVLRGLIYMLIAQQPSLISHIRKKYDHAGKGLFEDANTWTALVEIFAEILQDQSLNNTYLIIDALDECVTDLPRLLNFIVQSSRSSSVKWIVSSRNWPDIKERLEKAGQNLSLELNAESVSTAVKFFIQHKVLQLAQQKNYNNKTQDAVLNYLSINANDTFLWVALVCQNLEKVPRWRTLAKLSAFPPGIDPLYERMMEQVRSSDDTSLCKRILATIALAYRPLTLKELASVVKELEDMSDDLVSLREIVGLCGSLLTIREDTVYFVHQSAKDYLLAQASDQIFPSGKEDAHHTIFSRSLHVMSKTLRRDIYNLRAPGYPIKQVKRPNPDPLAASHYSCIYWVSHLCEGNSQPRAEHVVELQDGGAIDIFMRAKYLYWLEALSLCGGTSDSVVSMTKLDALLQVILILIMPRIVHTDIPKSRQNSSGLLDLVHDARRYIMYFKRAIEQSPLQAYTSALVFSPASSLIRRLFKEEEPKWITTKPAVENDWNACLQTLEGHSSSVNSVAFSPDSARLASASYDSTVKIWDASSGECLQTLKIGKILFNISFDVTGSYLHTSIGVIDLGASSSALSNQTSVADSRSPRYQGWALSSDGEWITYNSENRVWIPSEYRPWHSAVSGTTIGVGNRSGTVWICNFKGDSI